EAREGSEGVRLLDSFGDDVEAESVRELDRRLHERPAVRFPFERGEEAAVELDLPDGQLAERGKGRETCPEVVDRDGAAELTERVDDLPAVVEVGDERRLRDLEDERVGGKVVPVQLFADEVNEVDVEHVGRRDVYRDREVVTLAAPASALA